MTNRRESGRRGDHGEHSAESRTSGPSCRDRLTKLLAVRDYSETELRERLAPDYVESEITSTLEFARACHWLRSPTEIAERLAGELDRRQKGRLLINHYLEARGLPPVARDDESEFAKGLALVRAKMAGHFTKKFAPPAPLAYKKASENEKKMQRLLVNRGYDEGTISRIVSTAMGEMKSEGNE